jgi:hypothetical protein
MGKVCSVDKCDGKVIARGWCSAHWQRWKRHGDPLGGYSGPRAKVGEPARFLEAAIRHQGDECLIWPFCRVAGYASIGKQSVSRIICERVNGPKPSEKHECSHSCGRGSAGCINPKHLKWATHAENCADKFGHGTNNHGERHNRAKLTWPEVLEIRALSSTLSQKELAERYGIRQAHVSRIILGLSWKTNFDAAASIAALIAGGLPEGAARTAIALICKQKIPAVSIQH